MIIKKDILANALQKISSIFIKQVEQGDQTKIVKRVNAVYFSLGQFLNDVERTQRGIHGTANGLRVLADGENNNVINGLVRYLEKRNDVEKAITDSKDKIDELKIIRDNTNTIKLAEILYSLYYVKPAACDKEAFVGILKDKLIEGIIRKGNDIGWDFYLDDEQKKIQVLPTAFVVLALGIHGFPVAGPVEFLQSKLKKEELNDPTKYAEFVFSLYAILVGLNDYERNSSLYDAILNKIWRSPYRIMDNFIEQNVEYWFDTYHDYIRIPWQMYLLSITSMISSRKFYSITSQKLLNQMIQAVINGSFKYQYSGHYISSRTNAILYDNLIQIKQNIRRNLWHQMLIKLDFVRTLLGGNVMRYLLISFGLLVFCKSIYEFFKVYKIGNAGFAQIAPEFIGAIILFLIALGKKK